MGVQYFGKDNVRNDQTKNQCSPSDVAIQRVGHDLFWSILPTRYWRVRSVILKNWMPNKKCGSLMVCERDFFVQIYQRSSQNIKRSH